VPIVITPTEHRGDDFDLDPEVVAGLWRMEESHFWHAARNRWIADVLAAAGVGAGATFLDIGCGSGAVASFLHRAGFTVTGTDTAEPLVRKAHERCPDASFFVADLAGDRLVPGTFDAIGFFDVLEHVDDPLGLIHRALAYAAAGTVVLATVPALRRLHTVVDDLTGHKTRYEQGELAALFVAAGLAHVEERGIFRLTTPLARLQRARLRRRYRGPLTVDQQRAVMLEAMVVPPAPVNRALAAVCEVERRLGFHASPGKIGSSLIASGRVA
jgi:2-polyprenyl-3-methyl-5-hydroxy-6-metoxy-1,4-benzoquinol methylase